MAIRFLFPSPCGEMVGKDDCETLIEEKES